MPICFLIDEDCRSDAYRSAIESHNNTTPSLAIDVLFVGDHGAPSLASDDMEIVTWAAARGRTIVSGDANTLIDTHNKFMAEGHKTHGLYILRAQQVPPAELAEYLALVTHLCDPAELECATLFLPEQ